jgi:hypothetical protein
LQRFFHLRLDQILEVPNKQNLTRQGRLLGGRQFTKRSLYHLLPLGTEYVCKLRVWTHSSDELL